MMTDQTLLAQRLLEVAGQAYPLQRQGPDPQQPNMRETVAELLSANAETRSCAVIVAVLRELDDVLEEERRDYLSQSRLRALADSIEKAAWGNPGADPCRDLSAGVGIEDPGHTS